MVEERPDWTEDDALSLAEQRAEIEALAAEWAEWIAKGQADETDRLGAEAFS